MNHSLKNPDAHRRLARGANAGVKDYAAELAFFLLEHTGSVFSTWQGRMKADDQRALFGQYLGKGQIVINGQRETVCNRVKVCFGLDYDDRNITTWGAL